MNNINIKVDLTNSIPYSSFTSNLGHQVIKPSKNFPTGIHTTSYYDSKSKIIGVTVGAETFLYDLT